VIVTISRCYGASSRAVSRRAADRLGYRLVHDELPVVVAARLGMPADVVESVADRPPSFGERVLVQLGGALPETAQPAAPTDTDIATETRRAIEDAVRAVVAGGDVIVLGRMASAILAGSPDVVRVFLHAPLGWRVANVARSLEVSDAVARAEIARIDEARRTYAREGYRVTWGDPRNYDLVVDVSRFGIEGTAELIVAAVRATGA
jgi:cytidylate kinase